MHRNDVIELPGYGAGRDRHDDRNGRNAADLDHERRPRAGRIDDLANAVAVGGAAEGHGLQAFAILHGIEPGAGRQADGINAGCGRCAQFDKTGEGIRRFRLRSGGVGRFASAAGRSAIRIAFVATGAAVAPDSIFSGSDVSTARSRSIGHLNLSHPLGSATHAGSVTSSPHAIRPTRRIDYSTAAMTSDA